MEYQKQIAELSEAIEHATTMSEENKGVEFNVIHSRNADKTALIYFIESGPGSGFIRAWESLIGYALNGKFIKSKS